MTCKERRTTVPAERARTARAGPAPAPAGPCPTLFNGTIVTLALSPACVLAPFTLGSLAHHILSCYNNCSIYIPQNRDTYTLTGSFLWSYVKQIGSSTPRVISDAHRPCALLGKCCVRLSCCPVIVKATHFCNWVIISGVIIAYEQGERPVLAKSAHGIEINREKKLGRVDYGVYQFVEIQQIVLLVTVFDSCTKTIVTGGSIEIEVETKYAPRIDSFEEPEIGNVTGVKIQYGIGIKIKSDTGIVIRDVTGRKLKTGTRVGSTARSMYTEHVLCP
ncbi:hypothetical protein EVAR_23297_1 [Eumeta japonica]|uniref:Uncharacterized protein n=1 Tax=Eumeta variegata TaxID=151549 RepID=A0A4C1V627_EUMVA|nr:hypothetical protein EVAR_23297_1 [Eumeta japonica]